MNNFKVGDLFNTRFMLVLEYSNSNTLIVVECGKKHIIRCGKYTVFTECWRLCV